MCSIFGVLDIQTNAADLRRQALDMSRLQRHRGPDWSGIYDSKHAILVHERLAIIDIDHGAQPLYNSTRDHVLAVNGEIYNHRELGRNYGGDYVFQTQSDCEIILCLYAKFGHEFLDKLEGMFSFVLYDQTQNRYLIARDHMGITPLYTGHDVLGNFYVASEMKALTPICSQVNEFPPGHYLDSRRGEPQRYYQRDWVDFAAVADAKTDPGALNGALEIAVRRHMMSDVPYGVLLSGGLDSSLLCAIAQKYAARRVENRGLTEAWWPKLHSFAVGLEGSPDLACARAAAEAIGTVHHECLFTIQEGLDALSEVIYHLETYDVTTVRASVPMYLMARKIKSMGIKMVLSGEGSDEIFGGYLYFHKAPDVREFHQETVRKLEKLHLYDCLRANKSMSAWGIETRVPFLDKTFMDVAMRLNPSDKMCAGERMEKHILREAFAGYLPDSILWRQKEQFSDGVGYAWIDSLKEYAQSQVSEQQLKAARHRFTYNTPDSREAYLYRSLFAQHFPLQSAAQCVPGGKSVACSSAQALAWDASFAEMADPSGRAVRSVHEQAYAD